MTDNNDIKDAQNVQFPPLPESEADGDRTTNYFGKLFKYTDDDMRAYGKILYLKGREDERARPAQRKD